MLEAIFRIVALTRKELLAILKDPRSRFSLLIPPILQCLIYGYVATYDLNDVPYAVLDQDRSAASQKLLARLDGSGVFHRVANLSRAADIRHDDQRAARCPRDSDRSGFRAPAALGASSGCPGDRRRAKLQHGRHRDGLYQYDRRVVQRRLAPRTRPARRADPNDDSSLVQSNLETRWHMIPALIGTLTFIQTLLLTGLSVAREREQGTFDQLLVTPFRPVEIMAGKAIPAILVGIVQATLVLLVAQLWFRIPFVGSFVTLYAGLSVFLLAAVGIGLLLSSVAATMQQAMLFAFLIIMPFSLLSGLTTPVSSMPEVLQYVTLVNPLRYAIDIAHRVYLEGAGLSLLIPELWPLAVIALVTLSGASWMFRHRLA